MTIFEGRNRVTQPYTYDTQAFGHGGIDIVGDDDAHVRLGNCSGGVVEWVQSWDGHTKSGDQSYGNLVVVKGDDGNRYYHAHLALITCKAGDRVRTGDVLGVMGSTGNSTGAHTHVEGRHGKDTSTRFCPAEYCGVDNRCGTYHSAGAEPTPSVTEPPVQPSEDKAEIIYIVQAGDCLSAIAKRYGVTWQELAAYNHLNDPDMIYAGQKIRIPTEKLPESAEYYPAATVYMDFSIVDGLKSVGVESSYQYRAKIAVANGIADYSGPAAQNSQMLELLRSRKLKRA